MDKIKFPPTLTIADNIAAIKARIAKYEEHYNRPPNSVSLLGASKGQSVEKIKAAIAGGLFEFGENYLQEALEKMAQLADQPIEWHFIGNIQNNKTSKIAAYFNWVHSVDNKQIAKRLNEQRPLLLPPLNICIEVNIDRELNKGGVKEEELLDLLKYCYTLPRLKVRGLMAIPAPQQDFAASRKGFHALFKLWENLRQQGFNLDTLSMGMSHDFEAAIAEGATIIRLGTILFGKRI